MSGVSLSLAMSSTTDLHTFSDQATASPPVPPPPLVELLPALDPPVPEPEFELPPQPVNAIESAVAATAAMARRRTIGSPPLSFLLSTHDGIPTRGNQPGAGPTT